MASGEFNNMIQRPEFLRVFRKNVHGIGDLANALVLDAFEASLSGANVTALRPRLEHAQLMSESDMLRLGKLGGKCLFVV